MFKDRKEANVIEELSARGRVIRNDEEIVRHQITSKLVGCRKEFVMENI